MYIKIWSLLDLVYIVLILDRIISFLMIILILDREVESVFQDRMSMLQLNHTSSILSQTLLRCTNFRSQGVFFYSTSYFHSDLEFPGSIDDAGGVQNH